MFIKRKLSPLHLVILLLCTGPAAWALDNNEAVAKATIQQLLDQYASESKQADIKGVLEWGRVNLAPNWEQRASDGKRVTKSQALNEVEKESNKPKPRGVAIHRFEEHIDKFALKGDTALTTVTEIRDVTEPDTQGKLGPKGKSHRVVTAETYEYTWVKTGGKWLDSREVIKGAKVVSIDGKPAKPAK